MPLSATDTRSCQADIGDYTEWQRQQAGSSRSSTSIHHVTREEPLVKELDLVALRASLPERSLEAGDVGTVVLVYQDGKAYEVEFVTADGTTAAVETLRAEQIEPFTGRQILHARKLQPA